MPPSEYTLDEQLAEFRSRKFLATPIAGGIAWAGIGVFSALTDSIFAQCMSVFIGTGMIFYLALLVAKFTNEDLLGKDRPRNVFDRYFLLTVAQAVAVYSIAIPFFWLDRSSLPLTVGIMTGLMWIPFSGFIGHWVGYMHAATRTVAVLALWYLFPDLRFVLIPLAIVAVYAVTIALLIQRRSAVLAESSQKKKGHSPSLGCRV